VVEQLLGAPRKSSLAESSPLNSAAILDVLDDVRNHAAATFECPRNVTLELGKSRQIILGEIPMSSTTLRIDLAKLDTVMPLGGNTCCTIRDHFEMPTLHWPIQGRSGDA
jgi:hypothetical protein